MLASAPGQGNRESTVVCNSHDHPQSRLVVGGLHFQRLYITASTCKTSHLAHADHRDHLTWSQVRQSVKRIYRSGVPSRRGLFRP